MAEAPPRPADDARDTAGHDHCGKAIRLPSGDHAAQSPWTRAVVIVALSEPSALTFMTRDGTLCAWRRWAGERAGACSGDAHGLGVGAAPLRDAVAAGDPLEHDEQAHRELGHHGEEDGQRRPGEGRSPAPARRSRAVRSARPWRGCCGRARQGPQREVLGVAERGDPGGDQVQGRDAVRVVDAPVGAARTDDQGPEHVHLRQGEDEAEEAGPQPSAGQRP